MSSSVPSSLPSAHAGSEAEAPIPYSLTPAAEALPRMAATSVNGVPVALQCPSWCTVNHASQRLSHLEDVRHEGAPVRLSMPLHRGTETVMVARLTRWPFATDEDGDRTYLAVDPDGSGEDAVLYREGVLAFADQLEALVADIRCAAPYADSAA